VGSAVPTALQLARPAAPFGRSHSSGTGVVAPDPDASYVADAITRYSSAAMRMQSCEIPTDVPPDRPWQLPAAWTRQLIWWIWTVPGPWAGCSRLRNV
jgi:hypothetical protein